MATRWRLFSERTSLRERRRSPALTDVDLNALAREAIEILRPRWSRRVNPIDVALEPGDIPLTRADATAVREVVVHLVTNAIEALPQGGRIVVTTWASDVGVHCAIADTGTGMSEDDRARAAEPFFTTKGPKRTGPGLSASYGILEQHGGELSIASTAGRGTSVAIRLPRATAAFDPARHADGDAPRRLRLLLIDDDAVLLRVLGDILIEDGHEVVEAASGHEGLVRLERGDAFDIVITDLGMPEMSGWEVARAVKARWPRVPVVLITGWGQDAGATEEDRRAVDVTLDKPVTIEALRAMTRMVRAV